MTIYEKYKNLEPDEFVDIINYEGYYKINLTGIVISIDRLVKGVKGCMRLEKGIIKKNYLNEDGYLKVELTKEHKRHSYFIHRLLALRFIANPDNKPCVNHKDGNKLNNSIENLEWCTKKENTGHAYAMGLKKHKKGIENPCYGQSRSYASHVKTVLDTQTGIFYDGCVEASFAKNINTNTLRSKLNGFNKNNTGLIYV